MLLRLVHFPRPYAGGGGRQRLVFVDHLEFRFISPSRPSLENILLELKTVLPNADFVIEGYVDPTEPLRDEGPFGDHTGPRSVPETFCPIFKMNFPKIVDTALSAEASSTSSSS
jgi:3-polyprenyl-4-hydroxybenzoate decarboxylase